jgi:hypothetical protein
MPKGTTSSPLVEPDVRISLIRLSQKRSAESMRKQLHLFANSPSEFPGISFQQQSAPEVTVKDLLMLIPYLPDTLILVETKDHEPDVRIDGQPLGPIRHIFHESVIAVRWDQLG